MPIEIQAVVLSDAVTVRDGLVNILAGGITRLNRKELPAPMGLSLAILLEVLDESFDVPHELRIEVVDTEDKSLFQAAGAIFLERPPNLNFNEPTILPIPFDLRTAQIETFGRHELSVKLDNQTPVIRPFFVLRSI